MSYIKNETNVHVYNMTCYIFFGKISSLHHICILKEKIYKKVNKQSID